MNITKTLTVGALRDGEFVTATATSNTPRSPEAAIIGDTSELADPRIVTANVPTASTASISGRINGGGKNLRGVTVSLFDLVTGETFYTTTDAEGIYRFDEIAVGKNYVITPQTLGYVFTPNEQIVSLTGELTEIDFVGVRNKKLR